jgi:tagatose 1,6-diphosphate aldolase
MNATASIKDFPAPPTHLAHGGVKLRYVGLLPADPERQRVPSYHFQIFNSTGAEVGYINLRVGDTPHVLVCAGHIGYEVLEKFRGHGHAGDACRAIAPFVRTLYSAVTITCNPENIASIRTIEGLGATFTDVVPVPPDDPHYQSGARIKRRYKWVP